MKTVILAGDLEMRLAEQAPNFHFHRSYGAFIVNGIYVEPLPDRCYAATCIVRRHFLNDGSYSLNGTIEPLETL